MSLPDINDVSGSNRMIQHQMQLINNVTTAIQRLEDIEIGQQALMKNQEYLLRTLNQLVKKIGDTKPSTKKPPLQRPLSIRSKTPSASDVSKLLHLPQALQKNLSKFTENVLFKSSDIPDELIETGCLDADECQAITSKSNYKDQIRILIRKIKARGPQVIEKFLDIVGKDHQYLREEVNKSLEMIVNESKKNPVCIICVMKSTVDLKDVGDNLWEAGIISDDIYEDLTESDNIYKNKPILWDNILNSINNFEQPDKAFETLYYALEEKYEYLVKYLKETPERPSLNCLCCRKRRVRSKQAWSETGSVSDLSTTSEIPKRKLPNIIYDNTVSDECESILSSQDLPSIPSLRGVSFDDLDRYGSIVNSLETQNPEVSTTTTETSDIKTDDRSRHSSGHFDPKQTIPITPDIDDHNKSLPFVQGSDNFFADFHQPGERPELRQSISMQSNLTVVERYSPNPDETSCSTPSYDETPNQRSSQSTDGIVTPEVDVREIKIGIQHDNENVIPKETEKSEDDDPLYVRQKAYRRRRRRSSSDDMDGDSSEDNDVRCIDRAKQYRNRRRRLARQKSIPQGDSLQTDQAILTEQKAAYVGVRSQGNRMRKQTHVLSRQRSQGKDNPDTESRNLELLAVPQVFAKNDVVNSDTDLRTLKQSDTVAYSDFTA